jgi:linoleoyl-CoA desaturase
VKETADEYGIPYRRHSTMRQALAGHFSLLKRLGSEA